MKGESGCRKGCIRLCGTPSLAHKEMASEICAAVDELVGPIGSMGEDAMHALMCVNHHAYAVLEGGAERDVVALREAIRDLDSLIPEGSEASEGAAALSDLAAGLSVES